MRPAEPTRSGTVRTRVDLRSAYLRFERLLATDARSVADDVV